MYFIFTLTGKEINNVWQCIVEIRDTQGCVLVKGLRPPLERFAVQSTRACAKQEVKSRGR